MPRIPKSEVQPHQIQGVAKVDSNLTFRQRMRDRWRPGDTVQIHNITNQVIRWQWLDEQDEDYTIEDDTNIKIVNRDEPGLWFIEPGESDVLSGACAYMAVDAMYKMVCVMKTGIVLHPLDEREIRNFSLDDPEKQEQFLDIVFQGRVTPAMMQEAAASKLDKGSSGILENLVPLATESSEYSRRQASERHIVSRPAPVNRGTKLDDLASEFIPEPTETEPMTPAATGELPEDRKAPAEKPSIGNKPGPVVKKPVAAK